MSQESRHIRLRRQSWDLAEVEAWIEQHHKVSEAKLARLAPSLDVRLRRTRPVKLPQQIERPERQQER